MAEVVKLPQDALKPVEIANLRAFVASDGRDSWALGNLAKQSMLTLARRVLATIDTQQSERAAEPLCGTCGQPWASWNHAEANPESHAPANRDGDDAGTSAKPHRRQIAAVLKLWESYRLSNVAETVPKIDATVTLLKRLLAEPIAASLCAKCGGGDEVEAYCRTCSGAPKRSKAISPGAGPLQPSEERTRRVITERFIAGESIFALGEDYLLTVDDIGDAIRWGIAERTEAGTSAAQTYRNFAFEADISEPLPPAKQSNASIANRLIKECVASCCTDNCDAQQAALRLTQQAKGTVSAEQVTIAKAMLGPWVHEAYGDRVDDTIRAVLEAALNG